MLKQARVSRRRHRRQIPDWTRKQTTAIRLYKTHNLDVIAQQLGLHPNTVRDMLVDAGIQIRTPNPPRTWSDADAAEVLRLQHEEGLTRKQLMQRLGYGSAVIGVILRYARQKASDAGVVIPAPKPGDHRT